MSISCSLLGARVSGSHYLADARKLMAFSAAVGLTGARYFDTSSVMGIEAHPLFPVVIEWPCFLELCDAEVFKLTPAERASGVHAQHDVIIHTPIRQDDCLLTEARVVEVGQRRSGAFLVVRFDTTRESGESVVTTFQTIVYRSANLVGLPGCIDLVIDRPREVERYVTRSVSVEIQEGTPHIYTECSGIWNPVHTDRRSAIAADLNSIILHGTATLSIAISALLDLGAGSRGSGVRRLGARYSGFVPVPSSLDIDTWEGPEGSTQFRVRQQRGPEVISDGYMIFDQPA